MVCSVVVDDAQRNVAILFIEMTWYPSPVLNTLQSDAQRFLRVLMVAYLSGNLPLSLSTNQHPYPLINIH